MEQLMIELIDAMKQQTMAINAYTEMTAKLIMVLTEGVDEEDTPQALTYMDGSPCR